MLGIEGSKERIKKDLHGYKYSCGNLSAETLLDGRKAEVEG